MKTVGVTPRDEGLQELPPGKCRTWQYAVKNNYNELAKGVIKGPVVGKVSRKSMAQSICLTRYGLNNLTIASFRELG